jgi:NADPH-dependent ferric siderophore reductase
MRRLTVRTAALRAAELRPAQDVELHLREESGRRVKRRYTIRHYRREVDEMDLDVLLHGAGPGARWGSTASPGEQVQFQGPRGKLELRPAPWHLLIGDESAIPAIASIGEALPSEEQASAVIEVGSEADELPLPAHVRWVHRGAAPPGGSELLAGALETLRVPSGARTYLLGETRAMVALRALLESRGVRHELIFVKGYWNLGRPDRVAGRAPG